MENAVFLLADDILSCDTYALEVADEALLGTVAHWLIEAILCPFHSGAAVE